MNKFEQPFEEYIRQGEPSKVEKAGIWKTAIGLQQVDGLKPSAYLIEQAKLNIDGDITIGNVKKRIDTYYKTQSARQPDDDDRTEEADKVSARIAEILSEKTFSFSPLEFINIHYRLFSGIYKFAGKIRDYNITKSEWVLDGETVLYASANTLRQTLEFDFEQEKNFNYKGLTKEQTIEHIAHFIAYLWQIHIFGEGNTRTTAVFLIKYLHKLGFKNVKNNMFAEHSWYFRNALVRANYENIALGIHRTYKYLIRFLSNILFKESNILKNRELHVKYEEYLTQQKYVKNISANIQNLEEVSEKYRVSVGETQSKCRRNVGEMSERQRKIVEIIKDNSFISAKKLSELLNTTDRTIERDIKKMKEMKILKRIGGDRGGHWQILL